MRTGQPLDVLCRVMGVELPWPEVFDELAELLVEQDGEAPQNPDIDWDARFAAM